MRFTDFIGRIGRFMEESTSRVSLRGEMGGVCFSEVKESLPVPVKARVTRTCVEASIEGKHVIAVRVTFNSNASHSMNFNVIGKQTYL